MKHTTFQCVDIKGKDSQLGTEFEPCTLSVGIETFFTSLAFLYVLVHLSIWKYYNFLLIFQPLLSIMSQSFYVFYFRFILRVKIPPRYYNATTYFVLCSYHRVGLNILILGTMRIMDISVFPFLIDLTICLCIFVLHIMFLTF